MAHFLFPIIFLISLSAAASTKIVGGISVPHNSPIMSSTVGLIALQEGKLAVICSGVVIHPHVVLTAAHCVDELMVTDLWVANGEDPLRNPLPFKVSSLKYYSLQTLDNMDLVQDLAILVTEQVMDYAIVPIAKPSNILSNKNLIQAGYGFRMWEPVLGRYTEIGLLQMLEGSVLNSLENHIVNIDSKKSGVMFGDSGGPLFSDEEGELTLSGVLSQGGDNDGDGHAHYTHPYFFSNWMRCAYPALSFESLLEEQFPCDQSGMVEMVNLPAHNRDQCRRYRDGWDLFPTDPVCWPRTQKSCEVLANETAGDVVWDNELQACRESSEFN